MLFLLLLAGIALAQEFTKNCVLPAKIDPEKEYYIKVGGKGITNFSKGEGQYLMFTEPNADSSKTVVPVKYTKEWKDTTTKFKIEKFERKNAKKTMIKKIMIKPVTADNVMKYALSMCRIEKEERSHPDDNEFQPNEYEISFQLRKNTDADQEEIFTYGRGNEDEINKNGIDKNEAVGREGEAVRREGEAVGREGEAFGREGEAVEQVGEGVGRVEVAGRVGEAVGQAQHAGDQHVKEDYILQYEDEYKDKNTYSIRYYLKGWKYLPREEHQVKMKNEFNNQTGLYTEGHNLIDTQFCFINTGDGYEFLNTLKGDAQIYVDKLKDAFPALKVDWTTMNPTKAYRVFKNQGEKKFQSIVLEKIEEAPGKIEDFISTAFGKIWSLAPQKQEENEKNFPNLMKYTKLTRREKTNANKFIEKQKESAEYGLTAEEKKDIPNDIKEEMLVEYFKVPSTPPTDSAIQDQQSSENDQQAKDDPGKLKQEKNLNQNAETNLGMSVVPVGKNSALKFTILAVLACLIIQY